MLLGADQGADRRAGAPGLAVPHCCGWEPRPRAENRLFLEGGQGCSRVLTVGEEPALCSSQASAFVTEARPGVQMEVPEFRYSQTLHVCVRTNTYWGPKLALTNVKRNMFSVTNPPRDLIWESNSPASTFK